jgi:hypothetical protein
VVPFRCAARGWSRPQVNQASRDCSCHVSSRSKAAQQTGLLQPTGALWCRGMLAFQVQNPTENSRHSAGNGLLFSGHHIWHICGLVCQRDVCLNACGELSSHFSGNYPREDFIWTWPKCVSVTELCHLLSLLLLSLCILLRDLQVLTVVLSVYYFVHEAGVLCRRPRVVTVCVFPKFHIIKKEMNRISGCSLVVVLPHVFMYAIEWTINVEMVFITLWREHRKSSPPTGLFQTSRIPGGWGSQISWQSTQENSKIVSPTHRPPLPPRKYAWYSFLLDVKSTLGP